MAISFKNLVPPVQVAATQSAQYTASAVKAVIDKCTVVNTSSVNVSFSLNIVSSGNTAGVDNLVIDAVTIEPNETYMCPETIGHILEAGSFISTLASVATSLTLRISGRELS
jgi:hypothetical protein